ncbi:biopolymer transporter ExbD [Aquifex pyrophilus]
MNLRRRKRLSEEEKAYIDVVPLVDTLLAVFLFLAILAFQSPETFIAIRLPFAETGEKKAVTALKVQIDKEGNYIINGKKTTLKDIEKLIKKEKPEYIIVEADQETKHKFVVNVMDLARKNGIEDVIIAVRKIR